MILWHLTEIQIPEHPGLIGGFEKQWTEEGRSEFVSFYTADINYCDETYGTFGGISI